MIYHICSLVIQHNPANCQGLVELIFQTPKSWRQKSPNWPGEPCIVHDLSRAEKNEIWTFGINMINGIL